MFEMSSIVIWMKVIGAIGGICVGMGFVTFVLAVIFYVCGLVKANNSSSIGEVLGTIEVYKKHKSIKLFSNNTKSVEAEKFIKDFEQAEDAMFVYKFMEWGKISLVAFLLCCIIGSFVPSKSEMITYAVLKSVDTYNKTHQTSMLKPDNAIGLVDTSLKKIKSLIDVNDEELNRTIDTTLSTVSNVKSKIKI